MNLQPGGAWALIIGLLWIAAIIGFFVKIAVLAITHAPGPLCLGVMLALGILVICLTRFMLY